MPCPNTTAEAHEHHERVKADATSGAPATPHGRYLASTLRPWPGIGRMGECLCSSTLVFDDVGELLGEVE